MTDVHMSPSNDSRVMLPQLSYLKFCQLNYDVLLLRRGMNAWEEKKQKYPGTVDLYATYVS